MKTKTATPYVDFIEFVDDVPFPWLSDEEREELQAADRLRVKSQQFYPTAKNDAYYLAHAEVLNTDTLVRIANRSFDQIAVFWSVLPPNSKIRARFEERLSADPGFMQALELRRKRQANAKDHA